MSLVKLSRFRMLINKTTPFIVGFLASHDDDYRYLCLGIAGSIAFQAITSLANCLSDRVEDAIDHPARTELMTAVGISLTRYVVLVLVAIYMTIVALMGIIGVPPDTLALYVVGLGATYAYSFRRLKAHPLGPSSTLGIVTGMCVWVGWRGTNESGAVHLGDGLGPGHFLTGSLIGAVPITIILIAMGVSITLSGAKDLGNLEGDAAIGFRSTYLRLVRQSHPLARVLALMSMPYLLTVAFLLAGYRPPEIWMLAAFPASVVFAYSLVKARASTERSMIRELGYLYWQLFMSVALLAMAPTVTVVLVLAGSLGFWFTASRWLHPDPHLLTAQNMRLVWNLRPLVN